VLISKYKHLEQESYDVEELYRRYAAGERDFSGVDLSRANLNVAKVTYLEDPRTRSK
jgi:hypothetical protein